MARKTTARSRNRPPEDSEKKTPNNVTAGKEDWESDGTQSDEGESTRDQAKPVSTRRDQRARDDVVERATRGLVRLEGRRRLRTVARRVVQLVIIGALLGGAIYYGADYIPTEQAKRYWLELKSKLPIIQDQESPEPSGRIRPNSGQTGLEQTGLGQTGLDQTSHSGWG